MQVSHPAQATHHFLDVHVLKPSSSMWKRCSVFHKPSLACLPSVLDGAQCFAWVDYCANECTWLLPWHYKNRTDSCIEKQSIVPWQSGMVLVHKGHPLRCRAEQNRSAELQTGLQRAQQHILDLKEQHDLDLDADRRNHAAGLVKLRTHCCTLETQLAQLRQAVASLHALEHLTAFWPKAQTKVKYGMLEQCEQ